MGSEWPLTVEVSRVDSAQASIFAIILSLYFLVILHCIAEGRAGTRAFGSLRFATSLLFLLSQDSHVFKAASSFVIRPLTLGV